MHFGVEFAKHKSKSDLKKIVNKSLNKSFDDAVIKPIYDRSLYKEGGISPIFVSDRVEGKTDQVDFEEFILMPSEYTQHENSIELKANNDSFSDSIKPFISHGFWFKHSLLIDFNMFSGSFQLNHHVNFSELVTSPDFKIYYQLPEEHDVKKNLISIKGKTEINAEVHQVYSQSSIDYFDEWLEGGIKESPLIRLNNTIGINDSIKNNGVDSFVSSIDIEDKNINFRKEVKISIFSILLSVLFSIGFDYTRVYENEMKFIFSFGNEFISSSLWWSLLCLGFIPKFWLFEKSKGIVSKVFLSFLSLPVLLFLVAFVAFDQKAVMEKLSGSFFVENIIFLPISDYFISIYLFINLFGVLFIL